VPLAQQGNGRTIGVFPCTERQCTEDEHDDEDENDSQTSEFGVKASRSIRFTYPAGKAGRFTYPAAARRILVPL
jgi:hypothetical protein